MQRTNKGLTLGAATEALPLQNEGHMDIQKSGTFL